MPRNLKEEVVFTAIMAGLMVFVMVCYNVMLVQGFTKGFMMNSLSEYPGGLLVAIILDLLVVGPIAKKLAFKYIINDYMKRNVVLIGITISVMMVLGMVTCMSLFGIIMSHNVSLTSYIHAWGFNIIVALPLQLLIVGPIARAVLGKMQSVTDKAKAVQESTSEEIE
ncbi:DUF2798 domain-containing protein [Pediococcus ethanolidurans]|uniref:DUF2798 domain-containing protein n=1 Tax=Pediococcus ethanolidurans TaxID=319653 RepID=UPI001C1EE996|nr:DUF2798 domain-containing protein [Pediococcus ethanolidurans]MBU7555376.1 DUF2798 domain-containing protein [Pediococcus ethanolidurans]MBU7563594.1 DUF2798 domain-containing protein [Pediococcus ethanolidurans]MCV3315046.1 DUF2798 domain-containing protein [Pediococcus ethanolidurans]MCV3322045.1 DUF2798 domain-containing protein [Pediococcus ethanolidurans]MCV3323484.1 DUF2798 domain-containing protein [Pediococcus ethanolidurans]